MTAGMAIRRLDGNRNDVGEPGLNRRHIHTDLRGQGMPKGEERWVKSYHEQAQMGSGSCFQDFENDADRNQYPADNDHSPHQLSSDLRDQQKDR